MDYKKMDCDVLVIGAGGAGMRAALAASEMGAKVIMVSKSLLGKAHTVMAEGGIAAALGNVDPDDNWQVHFADIIEEGVYLSNWRMAEILAKEAPDRVYELESYGALFDRTPDGRILQRAFGGHSKRRLCHVGDKTGLEMLRTLEDQILHRDVTALDEIYITKLVKKDNAVVGAIGIEMHTGEFILFRAKATILATGGCGRVYKVTSNSWESTGDGIGLAYNAGAILQDMEMIQFHPTGMVYPPGVRGLLVTEGVRGEGGILYNSKGERFMLRYSPEKKELDARDVVARANYNEIIEGRGTPHGGVYLDISYKGAAFIKQKLPGMYQQFLDFAGVDITKEKMEVAPTVHYQMGGVRVDPDTTATNVPGLFAAGEVACGLHGANRLGGNSLADILVFGKRSGEAAAKYASDKKIAEIEDSEVQEEINRVLSYLKPGGVNPYLLVDELTETMSNKVGIVRNGPDLESALQKILELKEEYKKVSVPGGRKYNHGLFTALELGNMLIAAEAIVRSAIMRTESRGAHTRKDYPKKDRNWLKNIILWKEGDTMKMDTVPVPEMPEELKKLVKPEVYQ
ncbi:succinate dehydrogenase flavoprotein subunit [Thermogymnomonas acidicola]|uniref:Succinate dehydrogenase flavoprotein subunit n=1 Tax=Thermogymnomonas acidicola TaxID=399579 RepID=A0AA37F9F0_9ARCH|nr:FAD-binding protein [Thermogymnomonas acidicola]GGM73842.1 succinate dehydrogenase flavoprotein subunit [Thermogymnomonas acidicola]